MSTNKQDSPKRRTRFRNRKEIKKYLNETSIKRRHSLTFASTLAILVILSATAILSLLLVLFINRFIPSLFNSFKPLTLLFVTIASCFLLGWILSLVLPVSKDLNAPVREIILATKKVAKGDFSVRVSEDNYPKEINLLSKSFNKMTEELGNTEIFRNDFINNFSHEFKTPIASVIGYAKQLKDENLDEQTRQEYIDIIISESQRLADMSSTILLLTKYENQNIVTDKTTFSLDEQLRRCLVSLETAWEKKNLEPVLDLEEIDYNFNEDMLSHVWLNILSNAIKFSPENGRLFVTLTRDVDSVVVTITDEGIGMDDETQKHIFDKFYQGDTSHASSGNGLGLSLAKRVVTLANGKISVKSKPGKGSSFIVRLPVEQQPSAENKKTPD